MEIGDYGEGNKLSAFPVVPYSKEDAMTALCYDELKCQRVFVGSVATVADLNRLYQELLKELADGIFVVETWRQASEETLRERIAKRRADFFNS